MSDFEWRTDVRDGYQTKVVKSGNAVVTIHRPILSDAARKMREEQVMGAMLDMVAEESNQEERKIS